MSTTTVTGTKAMTTAEAAASWLTHKAAIKPHAAAIAEAEKVLKAWFHADTSRSRYRNLIGWSVTTGSRLSTARVRAFLGKRVGEFEEPTTRETLSAL